MHFTVNAVGSRLSTHDAPFQHLHPRSLASYFCGWLQMFIIDGTTMLGKRHQQSSREKKKTFTSCLNCVGSVRTQPPYNDKNPHPFLLSSWSQILGRMTRFCTGPSHDCWLTVALVFGFITAPPWVSCHQSAIVSTPEQLGFWMLDTIKSIRQLY